APRRCANAAFWALLGLTFCARLLPGDLRLASGVRVVPLAVGIAVVAMVALVAARFVQPPVAPTAAVAARERAVRQAESERLRNRLLAPPLLLALLAAAGAIVLPRLDGGGRPWVDAAQANTIAVGLAALAALWFAVVGTREDGAVERSSRTGFGLAFGEGGRLLRQLGGVLILPQLLATLGSVFAKNGVGEVIRDHAREGLPVGQPLLAVVAYCAAMPLFTILMGNAFAAFPLITLGIGLPFIVQQHGGDPAVMGAFGMLCGYCGTLVTPMAANFNVVPTVLLSIEDRHAVIKAQAPFALACWLFNVVAMAGLVYR
ncbi:MAG: DUF979 family protein, partial [Planctomycetes bacterium]|nr:DUF979 family protein [Planctomycetota bacterium]